MGTCAVAAISSAVGGATDHSVCTTQQQNEKQNIHMTAQQTKGNANLEVDFGEGALERLRSKTYKQMKKYTTTQRNTKTNNKTNNTQHTLRFPGAAVGAAMEK